MDDIQRKLYDYQLNKGYLKRLLSEILTDETINLDLRWNLFTSLPKELTTGKSCHLLKFITEYHISEWSIFDSDERRKYSASMLVACTEAYLQANDIPNRTELLNDLKIKILHSGYVSFTEQHNDNSPEINPLMFTITD